MYRKERAKYINQNKINLYVACKSESNRGLVLILILI